MSKEMILVPRERFQDLLKANDHTSQDNPPKSTDVSVLKYMIPQRHHRRLDGFIDYLGQHHTTWNDKGEIDLGGGYIQGSHIADMIKHAINPCKGTPPPHQEEFENYLRSISMPNSLWDPQTGGGMFVKKRKHEGTPPGVRKNKKVKSWLHL